MALSQCSPVWKTGTMLLNRNSSDSKTRCLNVVRSGRPEQYPDRSRSRRHHLRLNVVRSGRPEQWLAPGGDPDKELYQRPRALRPTDPHNNTLLSCHGVKHLVKPLRALPKGDDTTRGLAAAHTTTGPSSGSLRGTPSITLPVGGVGHPETSPCVNEVGTVFLDQLLALVARRDGVGQKVATPSRFMKAPWPVSLFQQVSPFSSEAHT